MVATVLRSYGWECGNAMLNSVDKSGNAVAYTTYKKTGSYALVLNSGGGGSGNWARWAYPAGVSDPAFAAWVYLYGGFGYNLSSRFRFLLSTGEYIDLRWNILTHTLDAYVNDALVASGTIEVSVNTWFHVQAYLVISDTGSLAVKIDGHTSINYTGDTQPGGAATASYLYYMGGETDPIDDLALGQGGFLGDLRCVDVRPSADTVVADWTPSTGSDHYATVDETPQSDTDYNETNINAAADELELGDFDGATYTPVAVTAWVRAQMAAATGDSIKIGIDSGGTDEVTQYALSTTWEYYFHTADTNPADAGEWEDADIDALKLRYESVIS